MQSQERSNSKAAFTKEKESICAAIIWTIPGQRFPMTFWKLKDPKAS
jgi:hypothetical protein